MCGSSQLLVLDLIGLVGKDKIAVRRHRRTNVVISATELCVVRFSSPTTAVPRISPRPEKLAQNRAVMPQTIKRRYYI
ncbi:hypothetical protein BC827DRAFT_93867 [Russula dissimulans]|nr:hypothetical protein BC827DRAFT_93867 [Russula dissimulans]